jgi:1-acyl-sn-glycerol-3-phosphate acyltransferase
MSERAESAKAPAVGAPAAQGLRVALSPYLFRGMLGGMAAVAVGLHRITGSRALAWRFAKARARNLADLLGVRVTLRGLEHLAAGETYVFTPNHQSHLDVLVLLGVLPGITRFAAKQELWRHPVMAAVLDTLGMIPIEREHPERAVERLRGTSAREGSVVIFPEGTRSRDGRLGEFRKGAFALAIALGAPVVPVVCRGTRRLMPAGSRFVVVPGEVEVVLERPIPTAGLGPDDRAALAARAREAILRHHTGW